MQVEYIAYGNCSGYGNAAKNYMLALDSVGVDVIFRPLDSQVSRYFLPEEQSRLKQFRLKKSNSDAIQIYHCTPAQQRRYVRKKRRYTVGFATFESTKAPSDWLPYLRGNNLVVVPSEFCLNTFDDFARRVSLVPHPINVEYWAPRKPYKNDVFTFMAMGSWTTRKGWNELHSAWKGIDKANLKIVTDNLHKARAKFGEFNNVSFHGKLDDPAGFMSRCDAVVCPTMGEGFGLVGVQALALNIPLIITDWSGVKEYANKDVACMIPVEEIRTIHNMDGIPQFRNREWAIINPDVLRTKMKEVMDNYIYFKNIAQRGGQIVRDRLSYGRVGQEFNKALESLNP